MFYGKLILGMCVRKGSKSLIFLILLVLGGFLFGGCDAIDNVIPTSGAYKINMQINDVLLENLSYARSADKIVPSFEDPIANDPDVTALMIFLRDPSSGEIVGWKVIYNTDKEAVKNKKTNDDLNENKDIVSDDNANKTESTAKAKNSEVFKNGSELIIPVSSLDDKLPPFPIPENVSMGIYTMVTQVMSGKDVLQKTEKNIFYLGKNNFSFNGINIYLPGISDSSQLISKGTVVMLEADLKFDKQLNPYIVWYDGKNKINEGRFSDGANIIFWKAPEQSGFFSLRAEVFPAEKNSLLKGYKKDISLLVSSKMTDMYLASASIPQMTHWYVMEGNLNNSKTPSSSEYALKPSSETIPKWIGFNGTYGIATGYNNIFTMPKIKVANNGTEVWQTLFRFKPLDNGDIFSVQFGSSNNALLNLCIKDNALVLTLASPLKTVSQTVDLYPLADDSPENAQAVMHDIPFITAGVKFSIQNNLLTAQINIIGNPILTELAIKPIEIAVEIRNEFFITLGFLGDALHDQFKISVEGLETAQNVKTNVYPDYNILWDEFALYYKPPDDILSVTVKPVTSEDQPVMPLEN